MVTPQRRVQLDDAKLNSRGALARADAELLEALLYNAQSDSSAEARQWYRKRFAQVSMRNPSALLVRDRANMLDDDDDSIGGLAEQAEQELDSTVRIGKNSIFVQAPPRRICGSLVCCCLICGFLATKRPEIPFRFHYFRTRHARGRRDPPWTCLDYPRTRRESCHDRRCPSLPLAESRLCASACTWRPRARRPSRARRESAWWTRSRRAAMRSAWTSRR